ncbi:MAG: DotA/TraY family protein [Pseudomonadota bacterium]|nr:DotA/TraY family protein [Pseudomonadota bacterium]
MKGSLSKTKAMKIFLLCCVLTGLSMSAFADSGSAYSFNEIFTIQYAENDLSIKMLQMMFGPVGNSLTMAGSDGTIITPADNEVTQNLFRIFNTGVLTMVMLLVVYSILFQAITISQDGNQGMSKQSSVFLTLRIVVGSSMLLPSFSGYSAIQVMVMNVIVYGVAFANYAWVMTYQIATGEIAPPGEEEVLLTEMYPAGLTNTWSPTADSNYSVTTTTSSCSSGSTVYVTAVDIYAMALCTSLSNEAAKKNGYTVTYDRYDQKAGDSTKVCNTTDGYYTCFGTTNGGNYATSCGSISFADASKQSAASTAVNTAMSLANSAAINAASYFDSSTYYDDGADLNDFGISQFDCSSVATSIPQLAIANGGSSSTSAWTGSNPAPNWPDDYLTSTGACQLQNNIGQVASAYANGLISINTSDESSSAASTDESVKTGWATAGQYFQKIALSIANGCVGDGAECGTSTASSSTDVSSVLNNRGTLTSLSTSNYNTSGNTGTDSCSSNVGVNASPRCMTRCFCLSYSDTDGVNYTLQNLYDQVIPSSSSADDTSKYAYYALAASATVAQEAASAADETGGGGSAGVSATTYSNENVAACNIAENIVAANSDLAQDMPSYLTSSNVVQPWQIAGGDSYSSVSNSSSYNTNANNGIKTDFATTNMILSMNMVLDSLTGMDLFTKPITSLSDYLNASNSGVICPKCQQIDNIFTEDLTTKYDCTTGVGPSFIDKLNAKGALRMAGKYGNTISTESDVTDPSRAGLFGMVWLQNQSYSIFADPLSNLTTLGVTMITSSVLYYTATLQQLFDAMVNISLAYTGIVAGFKMAFALANAASGGNTEPVWVAASATVEGLFEMMFQLDKFALELFIPLGSAIAGILFVQGVVLGVFLPFLAMIIYTFGVIGWLFSVIEAMVASSLVAMGLTHPEGHDLLGQTEQALMLLLGVFVRPITMIVGMVFAISISQSIMTLVNSGFLYVVSDYYNNTMAVGGSGSNVGSTYNKVVIISTLGLLLVYTYICYSILEMCYGLISQIPDRILRWIGGPEQQSQATQMAGKVKQDTSGAASKGAEGAGQTQRAPQLKNAASNIQVAGAKKADGGADVD